MRALLLSLVLLSACGGESPTSPGSCQKSQTAQLTFQNRSGISATYDVYVDGVKQFTISPQQQSPAHTVAAGVQHRIEFRYTNTTANACFANPIPIACSNEAIFCTF